MDGRLRVALYAEWSSKLAWTPFSAAATKWPGAAKQTARVHRQSEKEPNTQFPTRPWRGTNDRENYRWDTPRATKSDSFADELVPRGPSSAPCVQGARFI